MPINNDIIEILQQIDRRLDRFDSRLVLIQKQFDELQMTLEEILPPLRQNEINALALDFKKRGPEAFRDWNKKQKAKRRE